MQIVQARLQMVGVHAVKCVSYSNSRKREIAFAYCLLFLLLDIKEEKTSEKSVYYPNRSWLPRMCV